MTLFDFYNRIPGLEERTGAGGVVVRVEGDAVFVALIKETEVGDHHYVLPKGGVEAGEDIEAAARREIQEESGLSEVTHLLNFGAFGRVSYDRLKWQTSHYALYITSQLAGEILDKEHHYGFGWFPIDCLPPMFWEDERRLIEGQRETIVRVALAAEG